MLDHPRYSTILAASLLLAEVEEEPVLVEVGMVPAAEVSVLALEEEVCTPVAVGLALALEEEAYAPVAGELVPALEEEEYVPVVAVLVF
jgi:hypothetical protein